MEEARNARREEIEIEPKKQEKETELQKKNCVCCERVWREFLVKRKLPRHKQLQKKRLDAHKTASIKENDS